MVFVSYSGSTHPFLRLWFLASNLQFYSHLMVHSESDEHSQKLAKMGHYVMLTDTCTPEVYLVSSMERKPTHPLIWNTCNLLTSMKGMGDVWHVVRFVNLCGHVKFTHQRCTFKVRHWLPHAVHRSDLSLSFPNAPPPPFPISRPLHGHSDCFWPSLYEACESIASLSH